MQYGFGKGKAYQGSEGLKGEFVGEENLQLWGY
jgi:hypothetical protein